MCYSLAIMTHEYMLNNDDFTSMGEVLPQEALTELTVTPPRTLASLYADRPPLDPTAVLDEFMAAVAFRERYGHLKVVDDMIGLQHRVGDSIETYRDKLRRAEAKGKAESARFGIGTIMGEKAVVYALDWDYFNGSLGEVAGEKFVRAAELAERQRLPLVSIGASSGLRPHENMLGLVQMQRMAVAANKFQHNSDKPYISVLSGQVYGAAAASIIPTADVVVALEGADYGFAGQRILEVFEGRSLINGEQSAEANMIERHIDVLVKDVPELLELLGSSLRAVRQSQGRHVSIPQWHRDSHFDTHATARPLLIGDEGFYPALWNMQQAHHTVQIERQRMDLRSSVVEERLIARYQELAVGARRIDSEFIMQHAFDTATPLYNAVQLDRTKRYPAIIAAVASIGEQSFMVIGNQPSYTEQPDGHISKQAARPLPEDFDYVTRMAAAAERWKLPIVFLTDTLGAEPSVAAEQRGQSRAVATAIKAVGSHPYPTVSVITGALGSGGGLATTPFGRSTIMLDSGLAFATEPTAMAAVLYETSQPTQEQIALTLETVRATADDLQAQGLVDTVIRDDDNPYRTVNDIRGAIIDALAQQQGQSGRKIRQATAQRLTPKMISKHRQ